MNTISVTACLWLAFICGVWLVWWCNRNLSIPVTPEFGSLNFEYWFLPVEVPRTLVGYYY